MSTLRTLLIIVFVFLEIYSVAQISSGGNPLQLQEFKSGAIHDYLVQLPHQQVKMVAVNHQDYMLGKSMKYAHTFDVELNTENSGEWHQTKGFNVWSLKIKSEGAESLGLIFSKYEVPEGAKLFIYDEEMKTVYGAFTEKNNKPFKKLAVYPFPGEELIVQYEEPIGIEQRGEIEIGWINHDYVGILKNRWKRRPSGACHIDVNCQDDLDISNIQRSVVRVLSTDLKSEQGELGTATLINNTKYDARPLVISAYHVFDNNENAEIAVFDFNYESPYCTGIDGYDLQTISGSTALASFDSLDFMLVEMSAIPPAAYRPYYAGWNASGEIPSQAYCIHHPNGDVKKITRDEDICDSLSFASAFLRYGHWKVFNWESGTTEAGSSGGGLFAGNMQLYGTLSGGLASCNNNEYDAFSRLNKMWNYRSDSAKSVRYWLDPLNGGTTTELMGYDPYEDEVACEIISNYLVNDELAVATEVFSEISVTEVAERFSTLTSGMLAGVGVGIKDFVKSTDDAHLLVKVYSGDTIPEVEEIVYRYSFDDLTRDAMNYFDFEFPLDIEGTFFIVLGTSNPADVVEFYQSGLRHNSESTMLVNENGNWSDITIYSDIEGGASMLMHVNACGIYLKEDYDSIVNTIGTMKVYPNPASYYLNFEFADRVGTKNIEISDLLGRVVDRIVIENKRYVAFDISHLPSGIYNVSYEQDDSKPEVARISISR